MKISTKGEYGIRAMLYVAMHADKGPVPSHEIALNQGVPEPYLRQILAALARFQLIRSSRGPQGGHLLGRSAGDISMHDILVALEGHTTSIDHILAQPCTIGVGPRHCAIREVFLSVKEAVESILCNLSLADLAERQQEVCECKIEIPRDLPPERLRGPAGRPLHVLSD